MRIFPKSLCGLPLHHEDAEAASGARCKMYCLYGFSCYKPVDSGAGVRYRWRMTDTPDPLVTISDLNVENSLLRGCLFITARRLKDYQDAPAFEIDDDGTATLEVIIPAELREKGAEALEKAQQMLTGKGRTR